MSDALRNSTMNVPAADECLVEGLSGIVEPVEIRESTGKVLGIYTPALSAEEAALYEKARSMFDPAEMERRLTEGRGTGRALGEIIRQLESSETRE